MYGIFTYVYCTNQPFMQVNKTYIDPMGTNLLELA